MGKNGVVGLVVVILVVVAAFYLVGYFIRKKNQEKLNALEKRKEILFDLPVLEEIDEIKKMHLVGQSQNTFREWKQKWTDLSTTSFAELESQIFEVESLNESLKFFKAKAAVEDAEQTMTAMEQQAQEIRKGLKELRETEERNSVAVQNALDLYEELKTELREESDKFEPAFAELQKLAKTVESEFAKFVMLNTSGDPVEAREVLANAEKDTYALETTMKRIPPLADELKKQFPDQLTDLKTGYKKMIQENYVFPEDHVLEDVNQIDHQVQTALEELEKLSLDSVETTSKEINDQIETLYSFMEKEYEAKKYVLRNRKVLADYINHSIRNNRQLLIELDHTAQSYALNHNELGQVRAFQSEIEELSRRNEGLAPQIEHHELPFTEVQAFLKDAFQILDSIENQQVAIDEGIHELREGEKVAQEKMEHYEFTLRNLKRFVEKQRLPGLPGDYLDYFFTVTDRVEELNKSLNKIRIDMDQINKLITICDEDMIELTDQTHSFVDAAALTEQMLQYANRYRHSHPDIKAAIDRSLDLFKHEYRYQEALDVIGTALEQVEPGAFKRIEDFYFEHPDLV
ncbi:MULTISPECIES: septation ring formation regulator EzrA [Enterococcus]|uniref:Septation ring formation regulator EzrA n=1 Tax=Enterococcus sulfureus ATCC 49903 TaxID=1140003 RepID=S0NQC1_9ENTE|nr:septation ring formation regulator EzrA [Enterococcus sulfureus]EOT47226.1 septation ring formation regulator EzrA [Enterococcus sulfureus ATCC 49903]EOT83479.1 septation ring formation regulator EzrA [Enterococcus sulfureus ATCC 49903]